MVHRKPVTPASLERLAFGYLPLNHPNVAAQVSPFAQVTSMRGEERQPACAV